MKILELSLLLTESFVPITKKSVGYIVCGIVINDNNQVLMMQEAKPSRSGTWYLPAGRLEPSETLQVHAIVNVKEPNSKFNLITARVGGKVMFSHCLCLSVCVCVCTGYNF